MGRLRTTESRGKVNPGGDDGNNTALDAGMELRSFRAEGVP